MLAVIVIKKRGTARAAIVMLDALQDSCSMDDGNFRYHMRQRRAPKATCNHLVLVCGLKSLLACTPRSLSSQNQLSSHIDSSLLKHI